MSFDDYERQEDKELGTSEFKELAEGESFKAKLLGIEDGGKYEDSKLAVFEDENGEEFRMWLNTVLKEKFKHAERNVVYEIEYHGEVEPENGGQKYKDYSVYPCA